MPQPILFRQALDNLIKSLGLEKSIKRHRSVILWEQKIDEKLKNKTKAVSFKNGKLFIEVFSSSLRNELIYIREDIKDKINIELGESVIKQIIFVNRSNNG